MMTDAKKKREKLSADKFMINTVLYVGWAMMCLAMLLLAPIIMCWGYYLFVSSQLKTMRNQYRETRR